MFTAKKSQVDPRFQLLLSVSLVVAIFSSHSWFRLSLLALFLVLSLYHGRILRPFLRRVLWLRWFLLFVLLMHACFSPGHTLPQLSWLTYEGLERGVQVSLQVLAALAASMLMTQRLSAEAVAAAFSSLLGPLGRFGFDIEALSSQLLLTLRLVPELQREGEGALRAHRSLADSPVALNLSGRLEALRQVVVPLFDNLVKRADGMACDLAAGRLEGAEVVVLPPLKAAVKNSGPLLLTIFLLFFLCLVLP